MKLGVLFKEEMKRVWVVVESKRQLLLKAPSKKLSVGLCSKKQSAELL
jgi:hypothetical protein